MNYTEYTNSQSKGFYNNNINNKIQNRFSYTDNLFMEKINNNTENDNNNNTASDIYKTNFGYNTSNLKINNENKEK